MQSKTAPAGQFRVIGRDGPGDVGWCKGDYDNIEKAKQATVSNGSFVQFQIFDDKGDCVHESWG